MGWYKLNRSVTGRKTVWTMDWTKGPKLITFANKAGSGRFTLGPTCAPARPPLGCYNDSGDGVMGWYKLNRSETGPESSLDNGLDQGLKMDIV